MKIGLISIGLADPMIFVQFVFVEFLCYLPDGCPLKGAQSQYFELFWPHTKLPLNGRKPENNSLIR